MSSLRRTAVALLALLASTAIADAMRTFAAEPANEVRLNDKTLVAC
jgi:hypothetical protein